MISLLAARIPPGEPRMDVFQVMAKHNIDFTITTRTEELIAYLRATGSKVEGIAEIPPPTNSTEQASSNVLYALDPSLSSSTPGFQQKSAEIVNIRSEVSVPIETASVRHEPMDIFEQYGQVKEEIADASEAFSVVPKKSANLGITGKSPIRPNNSSVFGYNLDNSVGNSPLKNEEIPVDATNFQQADFEVAPIDAINSEEPAVKVEVEESETDALAAFNEESSKAPNSKSAFDFQQKNGDTGNDRSQVLLPDETAPVWYESMDIFEMYEQIKREIAAADATQLLIPNETADMGIAENSPIPANDSSDYSYNTDNLPFANHSPFRNNDIQTNTDFHQIDLETAPIDADNSFEEAIVKEEIEESETPLPKPLSSDVAPIGDKVPQHIMKNVKYELLNTPLLDPNDTKVDLTEDFGEMEDSSDSGEQEDQDDDECTLEDFEEMEDSSEYEEQEDPDDEDYTPEPAAVRASSSANKTTNKKKNFRCHVCSKSFEFRNKLTIHIRVHTGEQPFECQFCKRRFNQIASRNRHLRLHVGTKPFRCDVCGKKFVLSEHLKRHKYIHSGKKPHECDLCQRVFFEPNSLRRHARLFHST